MTLHVTLVPLSALPSAVPEVTLRLPRRSSKNGMRRYLEVEIIPAYLGYRDPCLS